MVCLTVLRDEELEVVCAWKFGATLEHRWLWEPTLIGEYSRGLFTVLLKDIVLVIVGLKGKAHGYEILKELEKLAICL